MVNHQLFQKLKFIRINHLINILTSYLSTLCHHLTTHTNLYYHPNKFLREKPPGSPMCASYRYPALTKKIITSAFANLEL
jgi:hypothetical protein